MSMNQPSRRKSRKSGGKSGRAAKNAIYQRQLRERKRLRAQRAAQYPPVVVKDDAVQMTHADTPPTATRRDKLGTQQMGALRDIAKSLDIKVGRMRKAELIDAIIAKEVESCG